MLYLKNTIDAQPLMIPKNGEQARGVISLLLRNTTDHEGIALQVTDIDTSGIYFRLAVTLPEDIATGEYQYQLMDGDIMVSCGLLFIGDWGAYKEHEKEITYKQYERE